MMRRVVLASLLLSAACAHAPKVAVTAAQPQEPIEERLTGDVTPLSYDLTLDVDPSRPRFAGEVAIRLAISRPTARLRLHGQGLEVGEAELVTTDGTTLPGRWMAAPGDSGLAEILLNSPAPAGEATLRIAYSAPFGQRSEGLFHVRDDGLDYAFTQFEPLLARRAFPSFDEPRFKTPFELTVTVPRGQEAVSNAPVADTIETGQHTRVHFHPTLPLPTYLVMLGVGPLDIVAGPPVAPGNGRTAPLPLRGVATKGKGARLAHALAHVGAIVEALEADLGAFPYPKLDLIAVPGFAAGAMENAGAVTFREWLLLFDPAGHGVDQARAFLSVAAHELAHHWFGDLVTSAWWDDLWLNEAFATWMEPRVLSRLVPDGGADEEALEDLHEAMAADSLDSSRRIRQPIISHHDVDNAFDPITYQKGAGVLAMFERSLGSERFFRGVRDHLKAHAHGTATADDLLYALSSAAGRDVAPEFRSFLDQPGVPLVHAQVLCDGTPRIRLRQERWLPLGSRASRDDVWKIPLCVKLGDNEKTHVLCTTLTERSLERPIDQCPSFVLPNADGAAYLRFSLDEAGWTALGDHSAALSTVEQMAVIDSVQAAFEAGAVDASTYLKALQRFTTSPRRTLAGLPREALRDLRERLLPEQAERVAACARHLYAPVLLSFPLQPPADATDEQRLQHGEMLAFLLQTARDPRLRGEAVKVGRKLLGPPGGSGLSLGNVDPTAARHLLAVAVEEDGEVLVPRIAALLDRTTAPDARRLLLHALGHARGASAETARQLTLTSTIRGNELGAVLRGGLSEPSERDASWRWFKTHLTDVTAKVPEEFAGSLPWYGADFCSDAAAKQVGESFSANIDSLSGGPRNLAAVTESIRLCAALRKHHGEALLRVLESSP